MKKLAVLISFLSFNFLSAQFPEGFEGSFPPPGWVIFNGLNGDDSVQWETSVTSNTGSIAAYSDYSTISGPAESWLVTPQFTPTASSSLLTFYERDSYVSSAWISSYKVLVSTGSQGDRADFILLSEEYNLTSQYTQREVDLSAYVNTPIYIAFLHEDFYGDDWFIDSISLEGDTSISCQTIVGQIDASISPDPDGIIRLCQEQNFSINGIIDFSEPNGDVGATYQWEISDGRIFNDLSNTLSFSSPGVYYADLKISGTNIPSCDDNYLINQEIRVSTTPDISFDSGNINQICYGEELNVTATAQPTNIDCSPPESQTLELPDGDGVSYETSIQVSCYDGLSITDINQIQQICLTIEHSYLGDLDIEIIPPSGADYTLTLFDNTSGGESTNLGEPWATAPVSSINENNVNIVQGVGYQYCFVPDASFPSFLDGIVEDGTFTAGDGPNTYTDDYIPAGSYSSHESFDELIGSQINGSWTLKITDNIDQDNGYVFGWNINFDSGLLQSGSVINPQIDQEFWSPESDIIETNGNSITILPNSEGQHCYTYNVIDNFGCEYSEQFCIDVSPEIIYDLPNDIIKCETVTIPYSFNLTENESVVLAPNPNSTNYTVSFHDNQSGAENNTSIISDPSNYSTSNPNEIIFVRISEVGSECFVTESFNISVGGPNAPTGDADQVFCDAATIADLTATGDDILWYDAASTGNLLGTTTALVNGQVVYASQTVNNCESTNRLEVNVTILNPEISASATVSCPGESIDLSVSSQGIVFGRYSNWISDQPNDESNTIDPSGDENYGIARFPPNASVGWNDNPNAVGLRSLLEFNIPLNSLVNCEYLGDFNGHSYFLTLSGMTWQAANTFAVNNAGYLCIISSEDETEFLESVISGLDVNIGMYQDTTDPNYSEPDGGWKWVDGTYVQMNDANAVLTEIEWSTGESAETITVNPTSNNTEYWVDVTINEVTCRESITLTVEDTTPPVPDLDPLPQLTDQCEYTTPLTAPTATDNCDGPITGVTTTTLPITASTTITWTFTDSASNSSTQTQDVVIQDNTAPVPDLDPLPQLTDQCEYTTPLTAPTATDNCDGPITGVTTTTLPITASTTITWTFTDSAGFSSTQTQEVIIQDTQALVLTAEVSSATFAVTHVIDATVTGTGIYEFSIDNGPWQADGNFTGVSPGEHIVRVRDVNGCGEDFIDLIVLDFPRFFTPNGDGYNDLWNINTLSGQPASKIYIFDRYGKLLKMIKPSGFGWDGTYNGNRMPTADYWFLLEYYDLTSGAPKQFRGHFTLKR